MFDFLLLLSAIIFVTTDFIYLRTIKSYFEKQVQSVQGSPLQINYLGAVLCYVFLVAGINYFIIRANRSVKDAFLLGLVIYGVYETTTYALFKNWSIITVFIDTLWGGTLFAITTYIISLVRGMV